MTILFYQICITYKFFNDTIYPNIICPVTNAQVLAMHLTGEGDNGTKISKVVKKAKLQTVPSGLAFLGYMDRMLDIVLMVRAITSGNPQIATKDILNTMIGFLSLDKSDFDPTYDVTARAFGQAVENARHEAEFTTKAGDS